MELDPTALRPSPRAQVAIDSLLLFTHGARNNGDAALWSWSDLEKMFRHPAERQAVEWLCALRPRDVGVRTPRVPAGRKISSQVAFVESGDAFTAADFAGLDAIRLHGQRYVGDDGVMVEKPPAILVSALSAYAALQGAIEADLGRRLVVTSQYRSPAYQALIFLANLRDNLFDVALTAKTVALPGYSQHADLLSPAFDFGTVDGLMFERFHESKEFAWLLANAARFGFANPYPEGNRFGIACEPWHWQLNVAA